MVTPGNRIRIIRTTALGIQACLPSHKEVEPGAVKNPLNRPESVAQI